VIKTCYTRVRSSKNNKKFVNLPLALSVLFLSFFRCDDSLLMDDPFHSTRAQRRQRAEVPQRPSSDLSACRLASDGGAVVRRIPRKKFLR
jgi:hypothetical protein